MNQFPPELRQLIFDYLPLPTIWPLHFPKQYWFNRALIRYPTSDYIETTFSSISPPSDAYLNLIVTAESGSSVSNLEVHQIEEHVLAQLTLQAERQPGPLVWYMVVHDMNKDDSYHGASLDVIFSGTSPHQAVLKMRNYFLTWTKDQHDIFYELLDHRLTLDSNDEIVTGKNYLKYIGNRIVRDMLANDPHASSIRMRPLKAV